MTHPEAHRDVLVSGELLKLGVALRLLGHHLQVRARRDGRVRRNRCRSNCDHRAPHFRMNPKSVDAFDAFSLHPCVVLEVVLPLRLAIKGAYVLPYSCAAVPAPFVVPVIIIVGCLYVWGIQSDHTCTCVFSTIPHGNRRIARATLLSKTSPASGWAAVRRRDDLDSPRPAHTRVATPNNRSPRSRLHLCSLLQPRRPARYLSLHRCYQPSCPLQTRAGRGRAPLAADHRSLRQPCWPPHNTRHSRPSFRARRSHRRTPRRVPLPPEIARSRTALAARGRARPSPRHCSRARHRSSVSARARRSRARRQTMRR